MRGIRRTAFAAGVALVTLASPAAAQYTAPPPDPGFQYIFDGTATGSNASFDKWTYASSTAANSATAGRATLDAAAGAIRVGASPFGSYWYTPRAVRRRGVPHPVPDRGHADGDAQRRHHGPRPRVPLHGRRHQRRARPEADRLQLRAPAAARCRSATGPRPARALVQLGRSARPVPARGRVHRRLLRAPDRGRRLQRQRRQRPAADDQRQRQQQPALDAGLLRPRDPDQRVADRRRPAPVRATRSRPARSTASATSTPSRRAPTSAWTRASGTSTRSARSASSTRS